MALTYKQKQQIGREVRKLNSGIVENQTCKKFGLKQVGGSGTKVDGISLKDNSEWSIKNTRSNSTQVHLTTQNSFINHFSLQGGAASFVKKFFGNVAFTNKERHRYKLSEIDHSEFLEFKNFLQQNKSQIIRYFISGNNNIQNIVFNDMVKTTKDILNDVSTCKWQFNETTIHLKNLQEKTLFHIQMKGSGSKKEMGYHGVLCHIHKHVFTG